MTRKRLSNKEQKEPETPPSISSSPSPSPSQCSSPSPPPSDFPQRKRTVHWGDNQTRRYNPHERVTADSVTSSSGEEQRQIITIPPRGQLSLNKQVASLLLPSERGLAHHLRKGNEEFSRLKQHNVLFFFVLFIIIAK